MRANAFAMLAALLAVALCGRAAELAVRVPDHALSVGDRMPVRVAARGEQGLLWGDLKVAITESGPWELVDGPRALVASVPPVWELTLVPMEVGELALPEIETTAHTAAGERVTVRPATAAKVTVASVLPPSDDGSPAPLADPIGVAGFPWEWALPAALVVLPLGLVSGLLWRRRRRPTQGRSSPLELSPLAELEALAAALRSTLGEAPEDGVCDRLAAGMRRFLERRSGEPALEMTSLELRALGRRLAWPEPVQRGVGRVTGVADTVRFGRRRVGNGELGAAVESAVAAGRQLEAHLVEAEQSKAAAEAEQ